ncbi:MAG: AAA family ATPase [Crenarchaeota archaeon]|nr:AAA family ATPase [Thermoproteota archaeon]
MRKLILVAGLPCAGKTTVAEILSKLTGAPIIVMGDIVRELSQKLSEEPHRVAIGLRLREGRRAIALRVLEKLKDTPNDLIIIEGIRSIDEVECFKENGYETYLIYVVASRPTREKRARERGRDEDVRHVPSIVLRDLREATYGLAELVIYADAMLLNEYERIEDLREACINILKRLNIAKI